MQDFLSHPAAEVLSVWLNMHDSGGILPSKISIHNVMNASKNSNMLRDMQYKQVVGSSNLHAAPDVNDYPPIPCLDASDL